jgi:hypothetical protein
VPNVRRTVALIACLVAVPALAADPYPARTGPDLIPRQHTHERAGTAGAPAKYAQPGLGRFDGMGMVNGATFGTDFVGLGRRPGRLFPGLWSESRAGSSFSHKYATDGPIHVPDPIATKPFRKAVIEAKAGGKHE